MDLIGLATAARSAGMSPEAAWSLAEEVAQKGLSPRDAFLAVVAEADRRSWQGYPVAQS